MPSALPRKFSTRSELRGTIRRRIPMNRKYRNTFAAASLIGAVLSTSVGAQEINKSKFEPLTIREQGSFAVGGKVITASGTFDPIKQGNYNPAGNNPAGETLHGDHAYVFYQVPVNPRKL